MAVSYVGVTSGNTAAGTSSSLVTSLPSGWAAGDVAVLTGHVRGSALSMSTPSGWTLVPGPAWPVNQGTNSRAYAWVRVLQAGDTAPTITVSGAMTGGWSMTVYRDADGASPVGQVGTSVVSGTSLTAPTLTGVLAGSALAVAAHAGVSTGTIPTDITLDGPSYTEVVDHATSRPTSSANQRMAAGYRLISSAGSYGGESFTTDVSASMVAVLVEVLAAAASVTVGPDGVSVPAEVGSPAVDGSLPVAPDGLTAPVALGSPGVFWAFSAAPDGLSAPVAVGGPSAVWAAEAVPDGLAVPVGVGAAGVSAPGQRVPRPYVGVVARPATGVVVRPDDGVVVRP